MPSARSRLALSAAAAIAAIALASCSAPAPTLSATATAAPSSTPTGPAVDFAPVLRLVIERLDLAPEVAASKYFSGQPVTDAAREQAVLDAASAAATEAGADPAYVVAVFADQIAASKEVQESLLAQWAAGESAAPAEAPDLATEVRPVLDRITTELVPALAATAPFAADPGCGAALADDTAEVLAASALTSEVAAAVATATSSLCD
ncbi:gamma subclass chorismate mutase AroQ [Herbiconiux moechotypicola]|uniref:gamma subclass chorismate mutase AroQ n=1 Tax=Herbiconiux moechotypicola TaxID=637393 RepID=UPI00217E498A|nr:gamma subclass chorismate mutase AroQ [Herbiconiux moechotypicola]MCS5730799.1 gamma subclass chorismate mutase AroQ [Herbiconiux moechotypicola]